MRHFGRCVFLFVFLSFADGQKADIWMPPYITKGPQESSIFRDDSTVTLECKGEGVPAVTYEWEKNGAPLNLNANNIKKGMDGTITITPATVFDVGYYQCFVKNQFGTALSVTSHLQKAFLESTTGTPAIIPMTVEEGKPFQIHANAKRSFPSPIYAWEIVTDAVDKNPTLFLPSQRVQVADNGDLYFAYAIPEDELSNRTYKSTTYNQYLDLKASDSFTRVTVTRGAHTQFAPRLAFSSEAITVGLFGEHVSLRCFFFGNTAPVISWTGPRNTLPKDKYTMGQFNSELIIRNITTSDEGNYTCTGKNSNGESSHTLQLKVEAKPTFRRITYGPQNQNVTDGEDAVFHCYAESIPEATVVWLQDGKAIDVNAPPQKFAFSDGGKTLIVRSVCRSCEGESRQSDLTVIQCNASNVHGYAFGSGYLNVFAKTRIISGAWEEVTVGDNEYRSLNFECDAVFDPSTYSTVQWYKIINGNEEVVHQTPPELVLRSAKGKSSVTLSITISPNGADRWTKYHGEYRCVASDGYSVAKKVVVLKLKDYIPPPPTPPENPGRSRFSLITVFVIALVVVVAFSLLFLFARMRRKDLQLNNLEIETDPRRRATGREDSSLPVYNAIQDNNDCSTINYSSSSPPPPPYFVAIQPTYLAPRTYDPPYNGLLSNDIGICNVDDAQTRNTAPSHYCKESRESNQYVGLTEPTAISYFAAYTDQQQYEEHDRDDYY